MLPYNPHEIEHIYIPIHPANADRSEGVGERGRRKGGRRREEDESGRATRQEERGERSEDEEVEKMRMG